MDGPKRCVLISDFNLDNLAAYLAKDQSEPRLLPVTAPFGQVVPALIDGSARHWAGAPAYAVVWTRPEAAAGAFARLLDGDEVDETALLRDVDAFAAAIREAAGRVSTLLVASWVWPPDRHGLGMLDFRPNLGGAWALARMNARLAEQLADLPNTFVLDARRWISRAGETAASPKLWYAAKVPYGHAVFKAAVDDLKSAFAAAAGRSRKLVVVDLDDTLWGGVVGEDGWQHLNLGGHDPVGEAFADVQRELRRLARRGILLAIASKNDEAVALEAIAKHPEMILAPSDFAAWRINWHDKARNIVELAKELNLGLQSIVFIDDSPAERSRVAQALPEVFVPDWPEDKLLAASALRRLHCFESTGISDEDRRRTKLYAAERERAALLEPTGSVEDWIRSLEISVNVEALAPANLQRAAQLLNKTNQMNLATRRLSETDLWTWSQAEHRRFWTFRVADRFGDAGLTGLASAELSGTTLRVVDFVLSCRVIGRSVEDVMVQTVIDHAVAHGAKDVVFEYRPTAKNAPCLQYLETSRLEAREAGVFAWDASRRFEPPTHVTIVREESAALSAR